MWFSFKNSSSSGNAVLGLHYIYKTTILSKSDNLVAPYFLVSSFLLALLPVTTMDSPSAFTKEPPFHCIQVSQTSQTTPYSYEKHFNRPMTTGAHKYMQLRAMNQNSSVKRRYTLASLKNKTKKKRMTSHHYVPLARCIKVSWGSVWCLVLFYSDAFARKSKIPYNTEQTVSCWKWHRKWNCTRTTAYGDEAESMFH